MESLIDGDDILENFAEAVNVLLPEDRRLDKRDLRSECWATAEQSSSHLDLQINEYTNSLNLKYKKKTEFLRRGDEILQNYLDAVSEFLPNHQGLRKAGFAKRMLGDSGEVKFRSNGED